jgi:uncharacterized protein YbjT (DUF2867 family)
LRILLVGASGFIGRNLAARLSTDGHRIVPAVRSPSGAGIPVDLQRDTDPACWIPRLTGIDAVINAAGSFREAREGTFDAVHDAGPRALFAACERAGVRVVIQISALGSDAGAASRFHLSKRGADDALRASSLDWAVVQPSLVYGHEGASARQLALLAALPIVPLPGDGSQRVQPIHIDDLCSIVSRLLEPATRRRTTVAAVGPRAVTMREWLQTLRAQMRLPKTVFIPVPLPLVRMVAGREAVAMLARGNTAPDDAVRRLLGRAPRDVADFVDSAQAQGLRDRARLDWLLPCLSAAVALTWVVTGLLSLGVYPVADSLALLARVGLTGPAALVALYGAAIVDLALGAGVYALRRHRIWLWRAQLLLIGGYSVVIAVCLPEFWLHPFGPLLKNVPLMAAILLLHEFEPRRWTT